MTVLLLLTTLLTTFLYSSACQAVSINNQQQPLAGPATAAVPFEFRDGTVDDFDDITTVFIDAFSRAPAWHYIHQFEDQYPGYAWHCSRQSFSAFLAKKPFLNSSLALKVITVPDTTVAGSKSRVVSFSFWYLNRTGSGLTGMTTVHGNLWPLEQMPHASSLDDNWSNCSLHLDMNMTRADHFNQALFGLEKKYLDDVFERQVYLGVLATHPNWDGNGFAAIHLGWGLDLADEADTPATLLATEAGHDLYRSVGFEDIYNVTVERLDGKGIIWREIMAHYPEGWTTKQ